MDERAHGVPGPAGDGTDRVTVAFIGGYSRSGGTLLARVLGRLPDVVAVGELGYVWDRSIAQNRLCGCGEPFLECAFWKQVGVEAFGGWDLVDVDHVVELEKRVARHRFIPLLLVPGASRRFERDLREYERFLDRLYRAVATVSGRRIVVDSTLDPTHGFVVRKLRGTNLRILHLVRDSRGTAYSWTKQIARPDAGESGGFLRTYAPASTALRWLLDHLLMHLLGFLGGRGALVRYEEFVSAPRREVERLARFLGAGSAEEDLSFLQPPHADLGEDHLAAGNRIRLVHGDFVLRLDDDWRTGLPPHDRRLVTLLTWPLLRGYGYLRRPTGS